MSKLYNIYNGFEVDAGVYPSSLVTTSPPPAPGYKLSKGAWITNSNVVVERLEEVRLSVFARINDRVLGIYRTHNDVYMEYIQREEQATAWTKANYSGPAPPQVTAFSNPARMNPIEACKLILYQAGLFHYSLDVLAQLRMMKHEVEIATSIAQVREIERQTMAQIDQVVAALP
jgi:hypothetical protein